MAEMYKGNEAIAEAALRAGARFYAGYPITPSTDIMEYTSQHMEDYGGVFIQSESELAAINMLIGAASCGVRSFTASSGPGISLMQEGISTLSDEELPALIITMMRYGNGLGTLLTAQVDYLRETRGGGHGDYRCIVLCPKSIQEAVDLVGLAYELGEKYRVVTILMSEGALGQMIEPCVLPEPIEVKRNYWALTGKYDYKKVGIFDRDVKKEALEIRKKYQLIKENEQRWEAVDTQDAEYIIVALGLEGRASIGACKQLREEGYKVGVIRPITAWPFPEKAFEGLEHVKGFITVEANALGQVIEDVALTVKKTHQQNIPTYALPYILGVPAVKSIVEDVKRVIRGEKEVAY